MAVLDPTDSRVWREVRRTLAGALRSSLHCALASTGPDGHPHVSPIGSLRLGAPGRGTYLDVFGGSRTGTRPLRRRALTAPGR